MALVTIASVFVARDSLGNRLDRFMGFTIGKLFFILELDEEARAVVVRGEKLAFVTDEQTTAARNFFHHGLDVGGGFLGWLVVSVMLEWVIGFGITAIKPPKC